MWKQFLICFIGVSCTQGWLFGPNEKCYNIFGHNQCFSTASPFTNTGNKAPESPDEQGIAFALYTPSNRASPQFLNGNDPNSFTDSHFNSGKKTRVIIHGFRDTYQKDWVQSMKEELLNHDGSNVILVDWEKGADKSYLNYVQAAANTRVVGAVLAKIIEKLSQNFGISYNDVHLIGHSLGSHVAGYTGSSFQAAVVGRITGLDPAGPSFENYGSDVRLDPSDAAFVDVIHTDGDKLLEGGFGTFTVMGHADFYPNGGSDQPGCAEKFDQHLLQLFKYGFGGLSDSIACSHMRALSLFTESINSQCSFTSYPCGSWADFTAGICSSCGAQGCPEMGFHADSSARGTFYLGTNAATPFCIQ